MAVLMLRHTTPRVAPGTCYGHTDLDVADSFDHEAAQVLERLPGAGAIVSSPLQRCRKLAERIATRHNVSVRLDARIMEMDFGTWEGRAWSDIPRHELDEWAANFFRARPHGGESVETLKTRVDAALLDIQSTQVQTLIITHAGVIRSALAKGTGVRDFQTEIGFGEFVRLPETSQELK